jgi:hypothetical protein
VRPRGITIQRPSFLGKTSQRRRLRLRSFVIQYPTQKCVNVFARLGSME